MTYCTAGKWYAEVKEQVGGQIGKMWPIQKESSARKLDGTDAMQAIVPPEEHEVSRFKLLRHWTRGSDSPWVLESKPRRQCNSVRVWLNSATL